MIPDDQRKRQLLRTEWSTRVVNCDTVTAKAAETDLNNAFASLAESGYHIVGMQVIGARLIITAHRPCAQSAGRSTSARPHKASERSEVVYHFIRKGSHTSIPCESVASAMEMAYADMTGDGTNAFVAIYENTITSYSCEDVLGSIGGAA